ncbi:hypothetical protein RCO48_18480 [Peribacillus frigoritolerans]|nr:hypothetical protein [Peribacillus frigoritolerans]
MEQAVRQSLATSSKKRLRPYSKKSADVAPAGLKKGYGRYCKENQS